MVCDESSDVMGRCTRKSIWFQKSIRHRPWLCFNSTGELYFIDEIRNVKDYVKILKETKLASPRLSRRRDVFQQYNDKKIFR